MIAALFVAEGGAYYGLDDVEPWPESRDARKYAGPHPVVAHPPCQRWGRLWAGQPLHIKRTGERKIKGDDDGCFQSALASVRTWGGVIEHPWGSHAWPHFGLKVPPRSGGWVPADDCGGWTCCVEQGRYGHYARKPTLLLAYGTDLPELRWGVGEPRLDPEVVARMGLKRAKRLGEVGARGGGRDSKPRIGTPEPFRNLLLAIAGSVDPSRLTGSKRTDNKLPVLPTTKETTMTSKYSITVHCDTPAELAKVALALSGQSGAPTPNAAPVPASVTNAAYVPPQAVQHAAPAQAIDPAQAKADMMGAFMAALKIPGNQPRVSEAMQQRGVATPAAVTDPAVMVDLTAAFRALAG